MARKKADGRPTWSDVKAHLSSFDRAGLIGLVQDLYDVSKENQAFLHARFGVGADKLAPYRKTLKRWLWPDVIDPDQDVSVSKALKAISDYRKATGDAEGIAELMVVYCEQAAGFSDEGMSGDSWFDSLLRVFRDALKQVSTLPEEQRSGYIARLDRVRNISQNFGWGVGDCMEDLFAEYGLQI